MTRPFALAALAALVLAALAGCATGPDRLVRDHPSGALDRPNGQPRWLPCMGGDQLCTP